MNCVLYLVYMNKEVIYLEPDDDITDILTKLQQAQEKLVALVPPKKATILRSAVNMKLVAKAAKESDKVAVVVTADPAILKLAMAAKIPVAKNLQSRPVVPTEESLKESEAAEQVIDENSDENAASSDKNTKNSKNSATDAKDAAKSPSKTSKSASEGTSDKGADSLELTDESLENGSKDAKNSKNAAKKGQKGDKSKKVPNFTAQRKKIIIGAVAGVLLIVLLVWALVFAPAAEIVVAISTASNNFSETTNFTTEMSQENVEEGKFYIEKVTFEQKQEANFTATGQEDRGEKARGEVTVSSSFTLGVDSVAAGISIMSGAQFTSGGKTYVATSSASAPGWDGGLPVTCNGTTYDTKDAAKFAKLAAKNTKCSFSVSVPVEALSSGEEFNLSAGSSWASFGGNTVSNPGAISGGSTRLVTIVSQSDVNKAKEEMTQRDDEAAKTSLYKLIKDNMVPIEESYAVETADPVVTPKVGEEVVDGVQPSLSATTTYSVYVVEKSKVEQFIDQKSHLADDQRIYSYGEPYFEHFSGVDQPSRLKAVTETGPTVTESEILERSKGKKVGEVQSDLKGITGVSNVDIKTSFFWVTSIPNDPNKVKVELTVEEGKQ